MMNAGILSALGSALLFGASTPLAKRLTGEIDPWLLAGILYLGSGIGLSLVRLFRRAPAAPLAPGDGRWLAGAILAGGVLGPVLLMWGLVSTAGSTASLLLNAEGVLTALLAWFAFHEHVEPRIAIGMVFIVVGTGILSWSGGADPATAGSAGWGGAAIVAACLCWALDNNLTRRVSLSDPVRIAALKGLAAGATNTVLALAFGASPGSSILAAAFPGPLVAAGLVGFLGYGVSLVLFVVALRHLGTARAGAYFSAAPVVGAGLAGAFLGEPVTLRLALATALMAAGVWLHLTERHAHAHDHTAIGHTHSHRHDPHHSHSHGPQQQDGAEDGAEDGDGVGGGAAAEHSHWHVHEPIRHSHPHFPDAHHRHDH
ncbi:MAG: EamA family transporter [Telmatospirillum sp.]|nr:EamA family transporter [Telmatospirillum sp.]